MGPRQLGSRELANRGDHGVGFVIKSDQAEKEESTD
jgi:hypothetical protein